MTALDPITCARTRLTTARGPERRQLLGALDRLYAARDRHDPLAERTAALAIVTPSAADRLRPPRPATPPIPGPARPEGTR